jgi:hypothetical protein
MKTKFELKKMLAVFALMVITVATSCKKDEEPMVAEQNIADIDSC